MDSIQTWFESLPLCVHSALWKWSKSEESKNIIYFGVFTEKSLRSVTLGSLITIMNVHGFHPNLKWSILTVPSFIPVNMSKIWGFKNFTFVLSYFFTQKFFLSTIFTPCAQNISKFITRMDCPTLWDIDYIYPSSLNEPIFMLPAHRPSK